MRIGRPPLSRGFDMPSRDELFTLNDGDLVKLIFRTDDDEWGERMWVLLTDVSTIDEWTGTLENQPLDMDGTEHGDEITFHPFDIIDYMLESERAK